MIQKKGDNMENGYTVESMCLRYIVPFEFQGTFEDACEKIESTRENDKQREYFWIRKSSAGKQGESDLYDYVKNEFLFEGNEKKLAEEKCGCTWILRKSAVKNKKEQFWLKKLIYYPNGIESKNEVLPVGWNLEISSAGLYLFRNEVGFLWYELSFPKEHLTSEQIKQFQNKIRELNREKRALLWEKTTKKPMLGIVEREQEGEISYLAPFLPGIWINELLKDLDITYMAERSANYDGILKKTVYHLKNLKNQKIGTETIAEVPYKKAPDKAILFSYLVFGGEDKEKDTMDERERLTYLLTNGYSNSYHFSKEIANDMKHPFGDVIWYATQEGAAYFAWPAEDNQQTFLKYIPGKIRRDYFTLYIKTLYQSFSLLVYAEKIQNGISIEKGNSDLFAEINLFLTKSMATSVNHIHHQSEFYVYLNRQLRVKEDVESVTAGLSALEAVWTEKRNREESKSDAKLQAIMGLFALLGISSAFADCYGFIDELVNGQIWQNLDQLQRYMTAGFMGLIALISLLALKFSIKAVIDAFSKKE